MKKILSILSLFFFLFASCSVKMAAEKKGVSMEEVTQCRTKGALLAKGAIFVEAKESEEGEKVEIYKVQKPTGSTGRAVMHGVLDVLTFGVWEVAGTPIEGAAGKEEFNYIKVRLDDQDNIKTIELLQ